MLLPVLLLLLVAAANAEEVTDGDWRFRILEDGTKELVKYTGNETEIAIPEGVTSIGDEAFSGCESAVFTVARDSYGEAYCKENSLQYTYAD